MAYFDTCPCCGANLDPGEKCDCYKKHKDRTAEANTVKAK